MSNEQLTMNNEKRVVRKRESGERVTGTMKNKKTCLDCLYCKVSKKSTKNCRLCYCSETMKKERHKERYWLARNVCKKFEDMTA